ncbi:MAG: hypothetical protein ACKO1U_01210 [Bacteroidota bacterium]
MIRPHPIFSQSFLYCLLTGALLMSGCGGNKEDAPDTSGSSINIRALRFEQDLFNPVKQGGTLTATLSSKYGSFFDIFVWQLTRLGSRDSSLMEENLRSFAADTAFRAVYFSMKDKFADFTVFDQSLTSAFRNYEHYLPGKPVPQVLTTLSVFSFPVICDSTHLAISIDMYLDPGCRFYETLEPPLPNYLRRRMRPEYLLPDAMKGWLQSDYAVEENEADLVQRMVSAGRIWFALKKLLPATPDSLLSGYSADQLRWCEANEAKVWAFFIDSKLLYSKDPNVLMKYVGEGPTTNGFPKESPGNIGQYIGYRIVQSYMKNHPDTSLSALLENKDLGSLFRTSKYKPRR